jgi:DNA-binding response OmpR family regulator
MPTAAPQPIALIVENDPPTRALLGLGLSRLGCQVISTTDSAEVLRLLSDQHPRVLVLDTYLPQINGLDLLRQARKEHLLQDTIVVMISAMGFGEVVQQAAAAGAHTFLVKPLDVDLLVERLSSLIHQIP